MTCSLPRSRTAVTVVVQDWPFRGCTTMFAPTSSEGSAEYRRGRWSPSHRCPGGEVASLGAEHPGQAGQPRRFGLRPCR